MKNNWQEVRKEVKIPILCKDFILYPYQVYQARVAGADAVLLIAAILSDSDLRYLSKVAENLDLTILVEVHNSEELERVLQIPNFNLIGICDINKKNLLKIKKKYPKIKIFKDYKKAIKIEKIELVAIASPTSTHYKIAKFSLNNNKNILVEKPITLKLKDLNSLYKISEKVKKNIFVDYPFLFSGATELIKKIITTKKFGNPYSVEFIREQAPIKSDSSVFWDLGISGFGDLGIF